ncbi:FAD-binding oxidoreductase [Agrococcus sp. Ld7]|uniref:FAD-binding oxidoreductase n=1 Tax=Agrococcus sp. Ld7 TaxID=649148 RepID=UPI0038677FA9
MIAPLASHALAALSQTMTGRLTVPGDHAYDAERRAWNLAVEQRPIAVAHPAGIADLRAILGAARDSGATVAVQPNGHGASSALEDAMLVRTAAFDRLEIDADARTALLGAGVQWGAVLEELRGTGLTVAAGTSRVVGAAGYLLGGGHSWLSRAAGLGAQSLRAAWILRPDGSHERVDDASDPDTMWALRGAGGVVGIVTELEIDLIDAPALVGGSLQFAATDGPAVLRALRDIAEDAPVGLNAFANSMRMPDAPMVPEAVRGTSFVTVDVVVTSERDLAPLDRVRAVATPQPEQQGLVGINLRMLGGALDRQELPAFATLEGARWLAMGLAPLFPGMPTAPGDASLAGLDAILRPAASERMLPTFLDGGDTLERCASDDQLERLRGIRHAADPDGVLHAGRLPR